MKVSYQWIHTAKLSTFAIFKRALRRCKQDSHNIHKDVIYPKILLLDISEKTQSAYTFILKS